jgi:hypothetical protein
LLTFTKALLYLAVANVEGKFHLNGGTKEDVHGFHLQDFPELNR